MTYPPPWIHSSAGPGPLPVGGRCRRTLTPGARVSTSTPFGGWRHIIRVAARTNGSVTGVIICLGTRRALRRSSGWNSMLGTR